MRKKTILYVLCIISFVILSFIIDYFFPFYSYCYKIDQARENEKIYQKYDALFSVELEDEIFDFLFYQDAFYVVRIDCKESYGKQKYRVRNVTTYCIDELIETYNYDWKTAPAVGSQKKIRWCIVSESFDIIQGVEFFEFNYKGNVYYLCYQKISE